MILVRSFVESCSCVIKSFFFFFLFLLLFLCHSCVFKSWVLHDLLRSPACCATYRHNCSQYLKCLKIFSRPSTPITPRFGSDTRIGPKTYQKRRFSEHKEWRKQKDSWNKTTLLLEGNTLT